MIIPKKKTSRRSEDLQGQGAYKNKVNDKKSQANELLKQKR